MSVINLKFSNDIPPMYEDCRRKFGADWEKGIAIAFKDTIYSKYPLRPDVLEHELVHLEQQQREGMDPFKWWVQYLENDKFRLDQEVEAYRKQVAWLKKNYKDREKRHQMILQLARDLSSPLYGSLISTGNAFSLITNAA